jgi:hypothetical protein
MDTTVTALDILSDGASNLIKYSTTEMRRFERNHTLGTAFIELASSEFLQVNIRISN